MTLARTNACWQVAKPAYDAYLVRHLDGATAEAKPGFNPLIERRKTQLHRLLCWEAERFIRDYW